MKKVLELGKYMLALVAFAFLIGGPLLLALYLH